MWRKNITTISLVVFGVLLIAVAATNAKWAWNAQDQGDVPVVTASWTQFDTPAHENGVTTQITVAPPYIILGLQPGLTQQISGKDQIRISIQTMAGSYSEYVASRPAAPVAIPVLLAGPVDSGVLGRTRSDLAFWD